MIGTSANVAPVLSSVANKILNQVKIIGVKLTALVKRLLDTRCIILSRVRVTVDGVWFGNWIY
jgi:hypothetical protein